jgi:hypothetical protein
MCVVLNVKLIKQVTQYQVNFSFQNKYFRFTCDTKNFLLHITKKRYFTALLTTFYTSSEILCYYTKSFLQYNKSLIVWANEGDMMHEYS